MIKVDTVNINVRFMIKYVMSCHGFLIKYDRIAYTVIITQYHYKYIIINMRQYHFFLKNIVLHQRTLLIGFGRFNLPISFDVPTQIFQQLTQLGVFSSTLFRGLFSVNSRLCTFTLVSRCRNRSTNPTF